MCFHNYGHSSQYQNSNPVIQYHANATFLTVLRLINTRVRLSQHLLANLHHCTSKFEYWAQRIYQVKFEIQQGFLYQMCLIKFTVQRRTPDRVNF